MSAAGRYLGVDLGTSGVKLSLTDGVGAVVGEAQAALQVSRPHPGWSEQDPDAWWRALDAAMRALASRHDLGTVAALGLAGQMHGAVLLDAADRVLRPAILWNDGRAAPCCAELERLAPESRRITGNLAMAGFTAPKLLWVSRHEPGIYARIARVLLPKDWLRLRLTGEAITDPSDASGTLWLDVARRRWSDTMLAATGLSRERLPAIAEGNAPAGSLRAEVAAAWGLKPGIPLAGGAGDNAAGAVGIGCVRPGQAFVSLGTSGVVFVADRAFTPDPARAVHAFCHCLPDMWHRMSVILNAAGALAWAAGLLGADEATLLAELAAADPGGGGRVVFLPYLSGERTPHNDPAAAGVLFGLSADTARADVTRAVLEGVAFALADGLEALEASGERVAALSVIGGGARSVLWGAILAAALDRPLRFHGGAGIGPALGAARLARLACGGGGIDEVCTPPPVAREEMPDPALAARLAPRRAIYRALYPALRATWASSAPAPAA